VTVNLEPGGLKGRALEKRMGARMAAGQLQQTRVAAGSGGVEKKDE